MDQKIGLRHDRAMDFTIVLLVIFGALAVMIILFSFWQIRAKSEELRQARTRAEELQTQLSQSLAEKVRLETEIQAEKTRLTDLRQNFEEARTKLSESFQALSQNVLESNNKNFLHLAQTQMQRMMEMAQKDLQMRQEKISHLLDPVKESLHRVDSKMTELEKLRSAGETSMKEQVQLLVRANQELRTETNGLVSALRAPQARGRWGEMQLRRVVEMAGMIEYCDFQTQVSENHEEQRLRPDLIVRLPGKKSVVVDAKTPLLAYLEAIQSNSPQQKELKLKEHAKHIRKHMDDLSRKSYWLQFQPSPEFVVLFLPGEHFFAAALEADPELIEVGVKQNVILATPTTLISLLRAVSYGWQQEKLTENVREVGRLGQDLYKRIADMTEHFSRLGKNLNQAVDAYNRAMGSLETRVLVSARKMGELNRIAQGTNISDLPLIETQSRPLLAEELNPPQGSGS